MGESGSLTMQEEAKAEVRFRVHNASVSAATQELEKVAREELELERDASIDAKKVKRLLMKKFGKQMRAWVKEHKRLVRLQDKGFKMHQKIMEQVSSVIDKHFMASFTSSHKTKGLQLEVWGSTRPSTLSVVVRTRKIAEELGIPLE